MEQKDTKKTTFTGHLLNSQTSTAELAQGMQDLMYNIKAMNSVRMAMAEEPEEQIIKKQADDTRDVIAITRVELPQPGGVYTYLQGKDYPFKGFPLVDIVEALDTLKKVEKNMLSGLYYYLKHENRLKLLTLIPSLWFFKKLLRSWLYTSRTFVYRYRIKPSMYSLSVRELYKAFDSPIKNESKDLQELRENLKYTICMFLEFDNAYRFRFQDLAEEIDLEKFFKSPAKELRRLIDIAQSREKQQQYKDKWTLIKTIVVPLLLVDRELKRIIVEVVKNLNFDRIKMDEGDRYYCLKREDYVFGHQIRTKQQKV